MLIARSAIASKELPTPSDACFGNQILIKADSNPDTELLTARFGSESHFG